MDGKYNKLFGEENNEKNTEDIINNDIGNGVNNEEINGDINNNSPYYKSNYQNENQNYNNNYNSKSNNQTQFHSGYDYNTQNSYNSEIVTTVKGKTVAPTILEEKYRKTEKKPKNKGLFGRLVAFALVAVIAGSAGGSATYMYMNNNSNKKVILQEKEEEKSSGSNIKNAGSNLDEESGSISGVVDKAQDSVVEIRTESVEENPFFGSVGQPSEGAGSGVVLTEDGYIVTNEHVVSGANEVTVRLSNGEEYKAKVVGYDIQTDLAVLKIDLKDGEKLKPVTFADSDKINVGDLAVAIGNPLGTLGGTVTDGIVSAKDRKIEIEGEVMTLLQTSAAVNPGNSGGGLFDSAGDLIGIVNAKSGGTNVEGLGFAIPSNLVKEVVNDIVNNGYVTGRPMLGIETVSIYGSDAVFYYKVEEEGIYIAKNNGESDLQIGDKIEAVDGKEVKEHTDIKEALKSFNVGETVKITVKRDGKTVDVDVLLIENIPRKN